MLKISTVSYQEKSMDNYNNNGYDNGYNNNDNRNNNHNKIGRASCRERV